MMDRNIINKTIIEFSDGSWCRVESCGMAIKINDTIEIFDEENNIITKDIDWNNEKISIKYTDGITTYKGKINEKNGKPNGKGEITLANGDIYKGMFKNGERTGKGTLIWVKTGNKYKGKFKNGKPNGKGKITYKNRKSYKVTFKDEKAIIEYISGKYEGPTIDGEPTKDGIFINTDINYEYKGEFKNGKPEGKGIIIYENGDFYKGSFIGEERSGEGIYNSIETGGLYKGEFKNGKPEGKGIIIYENGDFYKGSFIDGKQSGEGMLIDFNGDFYKGNFANGKKLGKGRFTVFNEETKELLYTQIYGKNGIMMSVEYIFEDSGNYYRMAVNYDGINRALNRNEINITGDLRKYIKICDESGNETESNFELIERCFKYQMQTRLKGKSGELDNENRIDGGNVGLQNLMILYDFYDKIDFLKKIRFEIEQNDPDWPTKIYIDIESYLNSFGLTKDKNPLEGSGLISIHNLDIDYFSINMVTSKKDHAVSGIIDLKKIKENMEDFIYIYDSSRAISYDIIETIEEISEQTRKLGGLQLNCQFYNHSQQGLDSCWFNTSKATIAAAKYPKEIIEAIRDGQIRSVSEDEIFVNDATEFNDFELLQMLELQLRAEEYGAERFGLKNAESEDGDQIREFTEAGNRPRIIYHLVNKETRDRFKKWSNEYFRENGYFELLKEKLGTFERLLVICNDKGLIVNGLGPKAKKLLSERGTKSISKEKPGEKNPIKI